MRRILVTQALNELKVLEKRIDRVTNNSLFVVAAKISASNVNPNLTKEDFVKAAKASMQEAKDLIAQKKAIKNAIIMSNATEKVTICGEEMTRAEAIELKSSIGNRERLLAKMERDLASAIGTMSTNNLTMEAKIDNLINVAVGKDDKSKKSDEAIAIATSYRTNNEWGLVNPLDLEKAIAEEKAYIDEFKASVDSALQISNCQTYIEVY